VPGAGVRWLGDPAVLTQAPDEASCDVAKEQGDPNGSTLRVRLHEVLLAIRDGNDQMVEQVVVDLSRSRRLFAPLALLVGAFAMLFEGVRLLLSNWTLLLIEVLPAMWIWLAMLDFKAHLLHGHSFHVLRGPVLIPAIAGVAAITAACFFLNAVFAFAIAKPGAPQVRPAFAEARSHLKVVLGFGFVIGLALAMSTLVMIRWGSVWFAVSLSIVIGVMMVSYVALPSRLVGMKASYSRRDKLSASAVGGALGAVVCTPPYVLGRVGILMLGSHWLFIPAIVVIAVGVILQSGATGAVKAVKLSSKLVAGRDPEEGPTVPVPLQTTAPADG
jgi:hypothetical protein